MKKKISNFCLIALIAGFFLLLNNCTDNYTPKPNGFFRIQLPKKEYKKFDSVCPYTFEYPVYARIIPDTAKYAGQYWINLDFPNYKGRLHISYKPVKNNLEKYLEDSRMFVNKHIPKASMIDNKEFINDHDKVYGLTYDIKGSGAASPFQFYVTDSTRHFLRGALYFNIPPNNDSLAPVIEFIKQDIIHLINTFKWKEIK